MEIPTTCEGCKQAFQEGELAMTTESVVGWWHIGCLHKALGDGAKWLVLKAADESMADDAYVIGPDVDVYVETITKNAGEGA